MLLLRKLNLSLLENIPYQPPSLPIHPIQDILSMTFKRGILIRSSTANNSLKRVIHWYMSLTRPIYYFIIPMDSANLIRYIGSAARR